MLPEIKAFMDVIKLHKHPDYHRHFEYMEPEIIITQ